MLTKIHLFYQIRKFYNIFGEYLGSNFITKLSDMTADNVHDVLFDINEALSTTETCFYPDIYTLDAWLIKLRTKIINFCERPKAHHSIVITVLLVAFALVGGYTIGRQHTIRQASLYNVADDGYELIFGKDIHNYTFEEVR